MKKLFYYVLFIVCCYATGIESIQAASIHSSFSQASAGLEQEVSLDIFIDAETVVNAVELSMQISNNLDIVSIQDSGSILNLWVEKPVFDTTSRMLRLSGVIPGGFSGTRGKIVSVIVKTRLPGIADSAFDRSQSSVLLNDGKGTADPRLSFKTSPLTIRAERGQSGTQVKDDIAPESFIPVVTQDSLSHEGKWVAIFQTQDKGSGVKHYEIQESRHKTPEVNAWVEAKSPYVLKDQSRDSYIFVRAIDNQGNERVEIIKPKGLSPWLMAVIAILCITLCLILIRSIYYKYGRRV